MSLHTQEEVRSLPPQAESLDFTVMGSEGRREPDEADKAIAETSLSPEGPVDYATCPRNRLNHTEYDKTNTHPKQILSDRTTIYERNQPMSQDLWEGAALDAF